MLKLKFQDVTYETKTPPIISATITYHHQNNLFYSSNSTPLDTGNSLNFSVAHATSFALTIKIDHHQFYLNMKFPIQQQLIRIALRKIQFNLQPILRKEKQIQIHFLNELKFEGPVLVCSDQFRSFNFNESLILNKGIGITQLLKFKQLEIEFCLRELVNGRFMIQRDGVRIEFEIGGEVVGVNVNNEQENGQIVDLSDFFDEKREVSLKKVMRSLEKGVQDEDSQVLIQQEQKIDELSLNRQLTDLESNYNKLSSNNDEVDDKLIDKVDGIDDDLQECKLAQENLSNLEEQEEIIPQIESQIREQEVQLINSQHAKLDQNLIYNKLADDIKNQIKIQGTQEEIDNQVDQNSFDINQQSMKSKNASFASLKDNFNEKQNSLSEIELKKSDSDQIISQVEQLQEYDDLQTVTQQQLDKQDDTDEAAKKLDQINIDQLEDREINLSYVSQQNYVLSPIRSPKINYSAIDNFTEIDISQDFQIVQDKKIEHSLNLSSENQIVQDKHRQNSLIEMDQLRQNFILVTDDKLVYKIQRDFEQPVKIIDSIKFNNNKQKLRFKIQQNGGQNNQLQACRNVLVVKKSKHLNDLDLLQ